VKESNQFNKSKKREYLFDIIPRWIKHSDLPEYLNQKYGNHAWNIFSCLISLDCRFNPDDPDWFSYSYRELAKETGTALGTIVRVIKMLEKAGYIFVIRGEFKGLKSKFKIANPLPTPKGPNSIKAVNGGFLGRRGKEPDLRYWQRVSSSNGSTVHSTKGTVRPTKKTVRPQLHYKNDYKNDKEKNSNSCANLSLEKRSKPTTWKEGAIRARDIKKKIKGLADKKRKT